MNKINTYNGHAFASLFLFPIFGPFALYYSSKARTAMIGGHNESAAKYAAKTRRLFIYSLIGAECIIAYFLCELVQNL